MRRFIAIVFLFATSQAWAAFGYYSPISINSAQVPSTQTDFPVLVSVTDARFKTVGNGGHVQNASGFDIRPYTDSTLVTAITGYYLERYIATTGEIQIWVKVSSLSSSTTPFVLAYGDSGISTDGSSSTTWSNSFISVYHLADGTTLNVNSSTGANNGTNHSATATAGQIDGGAAFVSASSQYIDLAPSGFAPGPTALTMSAWVNATSFPGAYQAIGGANSSVGTNTAWIMYVKSTGKLAMYLNATTQLNYDGSGSTTLSTATWYKITMTYDSTSGLTGYVNATSDKNVAANGVLRSTGGGVGLQIGRDANGGVNYWNGKIDQFTISSVARSANWLTTEYNNQLAPGTFETLGTEVTLTIPSNGWFYFFP